MDPILTAIAGALAKEAVTIGGKALGKLLQRVKEKFAKDVGSEVVLASAQDTPDDPKAVDLLARVLEGAEKADPAFGVELRELWGPAKAEITATANTITQTAGKGGVNNSFSGTASGNVVQSGNIKGDINFGRN